MSSDLAAKYLSMDENSFREVTNRRDIRPVELGLNLKRWRKSDLDALIEGLPSSSAPVPSVSLPKEQPIEAPPVVALPIRGREPAGIEALSIEAATKAIGLSRSTLYKLIADGRLHPVRIGRRTLIRREDLIALLEADDGAKKRNRQ